MGSTVHDIMMDASTAASGRRAGRSGSNGINRGRRSVAIYCDPFHLTVFIGTVVRPSRNDAG